MDSRKRSGGVDQARRRMLQHISILGASSVLGTLPSLGFTKGLERATLAYGSTGYTWAVPFLAENAELWSKHNVDLKVVDFPSGRDSLQALLANSANFSTSTDTPFVFAILQGLKPLALANYSRYSYDMKIVVNQNSGIRADAPDSLKGKKIGTPPGTSGHYALAKYLEFANLKTSDITQVNLGPADLIGALIRGDIDAFSWTAQAGNAAVKQSGGKVFFMTQDGYEKHFRSHQLLLTNHSTYNERKPLLDSAVAALLDAEKRIASDPAWPSLIAARVRSTPEEIKSFTSTYEFELLFDDSFVNDLVSQAEWAIGAGLVAEPKQDLRTVFRAAIADQPLKALAPSLVTLA